MSYDRADWHYGGEYPKDLPAENGGTHIGMFLAWAIMNGLEGDEHKEDNIASLASIRSRQMTGREFLFRECDGKLTDADFNEEGNAFAKYYYTNPGWLYLKDYNQVLAQGLPDTYYVKDTWENYEKIAKVITHRFAEWKQHRK